MDIDDDAAVRERVREFAQEVGMPLPWAECAIAHDPEFVARCLAHLRELDPGAKVLGSRLERREPWGLVFMVDYQSQDFSDAWPSRLVLWEDRDSGELGCLSLCARDAGPLPGCDYPLE